MSAFDDCPDAVLDETAEAILRGHAVPGHPELESIARWASSARHELEMPPNPQWVAGVAARAASSIATQSHDGVVIDLVAPTQSETSTGSSPPPIGRRVAVIASLCVMVVGFAAVGGPNTTQSVTTGPGSADGAGAEAAAPMLPTTIAPAPELDDVHGGPSTTAPIPAVPAEAEAPSTTAEPTPSTTGLPVASTTIPATTTVPTTPGSEPEPGGAISIEATNVDERPPTTWASGVIGFTLLDPVADRDLSALYDGQVLRLADVGASLSVRADVDGSVGSVRFTVDGRPTRLESVAPFVAFGDTDGDYYDSWSPDPGTYTITAVPFSQPSAKGARGEARSITITIID